LCLFASAACKQKTETSDQPATLHQNSAELSTAATAEHPELVTEPVAPQYLGEQHQRAKYVSAKYVGAETCADCHASQYQRWRNSHHDLAMQVATPQTVLGDFNNSQFEHYGELTRFTRKGDNFFVTTANSNGEQEKFQVAYTFGVYPLQQYLLPVGNGRLQALSVSWDSRPAAEGGQRWFHLYPDEAVPAGDSLHWTGPYQNWNSRCADCHSTDFKREYQPQTDSYASTWQEINVACEACHGPGAEHVRQAEENNAAPAAINNLKSTLQWHYSTQQPTASANQPPNSNWHQQLNVCGSCHSRRSLVADPTPQSTAEIPFHQRFDLTLISEPTYYADGQIREEDYVLGSFLQSKMHQRGVVCSNCHDPHSLQLKAPGNSLCAQCHNPEVFDQPSHHHHPATSTGAQCVNCHMPETTYMVVDPRRDHSIRIPRPDLSVEFKTPNACNQCHTTKSNQWAAAEFTKWLESKNKPVPANNTEQLLRGLQGGISGEDKLLQLASDANAPAMLRASALMAANASAPATLTTAIANLSSSSPLVRTAAVNQLDYISMPERLRHLAPLLFDPSKQVRTAVGRQLRSANNRETTSVLDERQSRQLQVLMDEYHQTLLLEQDTPAGKVALADWYVSQNEFETAIDFYRKAINQVPELDIAALNLADLYRQLGQDETGVKVLRNALEYSSQNATLQHALGLALIRLKNYPSALPNLRSATELAPNNARFGLVYGSLLHHLSDNDAAITEWQRVLKLEPENTDILSSLLNLSLQQQQWQAALNYAKDLQKLTPSNPELTGLIQQLALKLKNPVE